MRFVDGITSDTNINAVIYGGPSQPSTAGYAPYANFAAANAALLELLGNYDAW